MQQVIIRLVEIWSMFIYVDMRYVVIFAPEDVCFTCFEDDFAK